MIPQLFILLVVLGVQSTVNGAQKRFIRATTPGPASSSSHCPGENTCYTLNELITRATFRGEQQREIFSSSQTVVFLSGNHIINVSNHFLTVASAEYLILQGMGEVTITCLDEFYFLFTDVYKVVIKSLKFVNCNAFPQYLTKILRASEQFNNTFVFWGTSSHVEFNSIEIVSKNATGIVLIDGSNFKFVKSNFSTGGIGIYSRHSSMYILGCLFKGSSMKVYGSHSDTATVEFSVFEQTRIWPVITCSSFKLLELRNIKMVSNPAQFLMNIEDCKVLLKERNLFNLQ